MMDATLLDNLLLGLSTAVSLSNLFYAFAGCLLGTLIGVLPGLGPLATIAILLPITFNLDPTSALIMLAGIYYGAQYGGSTTSILMNLPGESSSVVTCLDGYQMARQGRAGPALAIAALGSFFAGCVGTLIIALFGPPLAEIALKFQAPENFSLMVMGLVMAVVLAHGDLLKTIAMVLIGLLFGLVGTDVNSGAERFTLGVPQLVDGIEMVGVALGLFGISEIINNLHIKEQREALDRKITHFMPTREDMRRSWKPVLRGTAIGSVFGILPGSHAIISSFASYTVEKRLSKHPEKFGTGMIEGVAGPEAANNAAAQTYFIPMLTLGIPTGAVMALMLGAMTMQGIVPGPQVMSQKPELFWGLIVSMWIGNAMLVVLNLPLVGIWVKLLTIPYRLLFPAILLFACIGSYSANNSAVDIYLCALFGLMGYLFIKFGCELAPLLLGFVLGPMMEENLRRALFISEGDPSVLIQRPISASMLAISAAALVLVVLPAVRRKRSEVLVASD
ncbi:tripartite tricarboxylate transporter permease [Imbroritus primus]|uniref:tripartite tricarboxylate transporter permease n=1 Tax=Imbroritus primus TaxID=3058603 RepID=UPI003D1606A0